MQALRRKLAWLANSNLDPILILLLLVNGFFLLYRLADPEGSLIFDESYYVQMARVILGMPVIHDHLPEIIHSGCDPNSEHPPLAKLIMAAGMYIFRDNALGWRLPSVALGLLGTTMVYAIVRTMGGNRNQARLAAFVLAFDNLYFVHSRIATLDIYMVSFALLGTWLYLKGRYEFSGLAFGLSTLCKINGLLGVFGILLYELGRWKIPPEQPAEPKPEPEPEATDTKPWHRFLLMFFFYILFSFLALGVMDRYFTEFSGPVAHVIYIFTYGTNLARDVGVAPQGAEATPLQWWLNIKTFEYLDVWGTSATGITTPLVTFKGCMNIYLISAAPFVLYFNFLQARRGNRLALLVTCLFLANYVPILVTWIKSRRICYLFYMLPSMPSFVMGIGCLSGWLPPWTRNVLIVATLYAFFSLFPFPLR